MSLPGLPNELGSSDSAYQPRPMRRNVRFASDPSVPPIQITDSAGQIHCGVLTNESFSGIAATVVDAGSLEIGQQTAVVYFGHPMPGIIRRIVAQPDGAWMVGIEWK